MTPDSPLAAILRSRGLANDDGVHRAARLTRCTCHQAVVRGLDAERAALAVTADPDPISPIGEVIALAAGRATYSLRDTFTATGRPTFVLDERRPWTIRAARSALVVAEHRCGATPLPAAELPARLARPPLPDEPPF